MTREAIGCCGAYCGTCRAFGSPCKGCSLGYRTGERDLAKAKCRIKVCCVSKHFSTCADCEQYAHCPTLREFHSKPGYKYRKYHEALEFIRAHGYDSFLAIAHGWRGACGKYPK